LSCQNEDNQHFFNLWEVPAGDSVKVQKGQAKP